MTQTLENAYAIIIGVDENEIPSLALPTVAKDVQAVYDVLIHPQRCGYAPDNVRLVKGTEATKDNIFDAFYWLQDKLTADDATAVVYYSGHGWHDTDADAYYLIPYDLGERRRVRQRGIKAEELNAEIAALQPQRLLVVLDCCHAAGVDAKDLSGATAVTPAAFPMSVPQAKILPAVRPSDQAGLDQLAEGQGRAILNSSTGAEKSYVRTDGKMSIFTYHLVEALTGHAPHGAGDTTVLVTDAMSWVARRVAETARAHGLAQTPVMKTSGVFPIALLLGGAGTKGLDALPDPLEPLPPAPTTGRTTTFNQEGQTVHGQQFNIGGDAHIGQIGDTINTGGGDYVGGDKITGDKIKTGDIRDSSVAIGRGARSEMRVQKGIDPAVLHSLFAPLLAQVGGRPQAAALAEELQAEVARGDKADDNKMAGLVQDLVDAAPTAVESVVNLFSNALIAKAAGSATKFVLGRLRR